MLATEQPANVGWILAAEGEAASGPAPGAFATYTEIMPTPKICVQGHTPLLENVRAALVADGCEPCPVQATDEQQNCDVLISNGKLPDELSGRRTSDFATLIIGPAPASEQPPLTLADGAAPKLSLSSDATVREVVTAALLLAEIVTLRRQQDKSQGDRRRLTELALSDPLTGIANRRAWDERAAELIQSASGRPCCVAIVDVDGFKSINTSLGHPVGDACLREVAGRVSSAVRRHDLVARLGGDEFAVLLAGVDAALAPKLVERIRSRIGERPSTAATGAELHASAGWALVTPGADAASSLATAMETADAALRQAKAAGKNRTLP